MPGAILFMLGAAIIQVVVGVVAAIAFAVDIIRFGAAAIFCAMYRPLTRLG